MPLSPRKPLRRLPIVFALAVGLMPARAADNSGRIVRLDVAALGSDGQPITDLRESELQIFDNGARQAMVFFRRDEPQRDPAGALGPGEYSNRAGGALPPATILLFDMLNQRVLVDAYGRNDIVKAVHDLKVKDTEGLFLYILTNTGGLLPVHAISIPEGDAETPGTAWLSQIGPLLDGVLRKMGGFRPMDDHVPGIRFDATFRAMGTLASMLAEVPGRKGLVWITHGVPITLPDLAGFPVDMAAPVRRLSEALERAHVSVYAVQQSEQGAGADLATLTARTLQAMSSLTGGRYYPSDNIDPAIRQAIAEGRAQYTVAYAPDQKWNGKFHKIRIAGDRPGAHFNTKQGYDALAEPTPEEQEKAVVASADASPFDDSDIGLRATAVAADASARIRIRINAGDLLFLPRGDRFIARLLIAVRDPGAKDTAGFGGRPDDGASALEWNFNADERAKALRDGVVVERAVPAAPARQVRLLVVDRQLLDYGTLSVPLR